MDFQQLRSFQLVARTLSFTRAAEVLDYAQSSVTAQIQSLEKELDVRLFDRLGRRIVLTEAGRRLLEYAERILQMTDEALLAVTHPEKPTGHLHMSAPETLTAFRLPFLLRKFRSKFPGIQLLLQYVHRSEVFQRISEGKVDIAFNFDVPNFEPPTNICVRELARERLLVIAPPDHPLAGCAHVEAQDFRHELMLLTETFCTYRHMFEDAVAAQGVRLAETMEYHSVEAIKQCVMAGVGLGVLPEVAVARELREERLVALEWSEEPLILSTYVMWHRERALTPVMEELLRITDSYFLDPSPLSMDFINSFR
ncbi:MAG: LysR family transcriptional regulator [Anaerolineae bacterium]|nr:LysR family transcriptional regulator [Anaerolineae bacterium]